jgi:hypothetical protein
MLLTDSDSRVAAVVIALLVLLFAEVGFQVARKRHAGEVEDAPFGAVQGAALTLAALMLGFSFDVALNRYDARRLQVIAEADAIGTTALRTELLDPQTAAQIRGDLRRFVDAQITYLSTNTDSEARSAAAERSAALEFRIWRLAAAQERRDPRSTSEPLLLASLNEMIDASGRQEAVISARIPEVVLWILLVVVFFSAGLLGYGFGRTGKRGLIPSVLFAVMVGLVIAAILDLDSPQHGLISVSLEPMRTVQLLLQQHP